MKVLNWPAAPYRMRTTDNLSCLLNRSGWRPKREILRAGAVFVLVLAVLCLVPVSALPGPGDLSPGNTGAGTASGPVLEPVTTGPSTYPSISSNDSTGMLSRSFTFPFQESTIAITGRVNASVYYGAKTGDKYATVPEGVTPADAAPAYYRAFIEDPHQEEMYRDLLGTFRVVRQEHGYTDDEYLELLTVFVQSLPYANVSGTRPDTPARFPAETLIDGTGDCDDKSLLLAGLLSREGYDTVLLLFLPEHHMAVGVKDHDAQYRNTGYLYVETTGISLIGIPPSNQSLKYILANQSSGQPQLESTPLVIRVGTGNRTYSHAGETSFIAGQKEAADAEVALLRHQLNAFSGDDPVRYRQLLEDYYVYTGIHNTLVKNPVDRAGEYAYLVRLAPVYLCTDLPDKAPAGQLVLPPTGPGGTALCRACLPLALHRPGQYRCPQGAGIVAA